MPLFTGLLFTRNPIAKVFSSYAREGVDTSQRSLHHSLNVDLHSPWYLTSLGRYIESILSQSDWPMDIRLRKVQIARLPRDRPS